MHIEEVEWIDKEGREAVLKVTDGIKSIICFSCPCYYTVGDILDEALECLDTYDIVLCESKEYHIEKMNGNFKYKLKGRLHDIQNGIIYVYGFKIHIDEKKIPGDITEEMYIQLVTSRIDVW